MNPCHASLANRRFEFGKSTPSANHADTPKASAATSDNQPNSGVGATGELSIIVTINPTSTMAIAVHCPATFRRGETHRISEPATCGAADLRNEVEVSTFRP